MNLAYKIIQISTCCFMGLLPASLFAITVSAYTEDPIIHVGDTVMFSFLIDPEQKGINVVEGSIQFSDSQGISVRGLSVSDSVLSLWPTKPSVSADGKQIDFIGGIPGSAITDEGVLFKVALYFSKPGSLTISPKNIIAYSNDGAGTPYYTSAVSHVITILPQKKDMIPRNEWSDLISGDITPPTSFSIVLNQDDKMYDGKKFISFSTRDTESGVDYYEVIEGTHQPVRSTHSYVLQEQLKSVPIIVIAHDRAGNTQTAVYNNDTRRLKYFVILIVVSSILFVIFYFVKRNKKRNV